MEMEITRYAFAHLSKDDEHYQEKLAALQDAGFWFDPVKDEWIKPEPLLEGEEVRLQYFSSEGVYLDRSNICRRKCCSSYWRTASNTTSPATAGSGRKTGTAAAEPVFSSTPPGISIPGWGRESPAFCLGVSHEENYSTAARGASPEGRAAAYTSGQDRPDARKGH